MLKSIDNFLNKITMYRLALYCLICLLLAAAVLGMAGKIPYGPVALLYSTLFITVICYCANLIFAQVFGAPANSESDYITALILVLIITPISSLQNHAYFIFVGWAAVWSQASKYIFAIGKKHIFNPAAFAVALTAFTINQSATWWVGTAWMLPFVAAVGFLIVRKIRRADLFWSFFITAFISVVGYQLFKGSNFFTAVNRVVLNSPIVFFGTIMLTEPVTTPPTKKLRQSYGVLVGILFSYWVRIGPIFSTPELALLVGNVYSYLVSPKKKLILKLKRVVRLTSDTYDFVFLPDKQFKFKPGQYLEWTLGHEKTDSRGNRRYFTVASSPTEGEITMGVKFYPKASSFKKSLAAMKLGQSIVASQLAGDFTMPTDTSQKLCFIAGGIGVTPFRSMVKFLLDQNQRRDITILYSNRTEGDIAYKNIFDDASSKLGVKTIYTLTDAANIPIGWAGETGYINEKMLARQIPDFKQRMFYISGPQSMVTYFDEVLGKIGVPQSRIKKDYFPGFA